MVSSSTKRIAEGNMTYEEWKNRPVYKAQCVTWRRACELTRIPYPENEVAARMKD